MGANEGSVSTVWSAEGKRPEFVGAKRAASALQARAATIELSEHRFDTITWMDGDGSIMEEKTWKDGQPIPATEKIPVRASDNQNVYSFTEWDITTDQDGNLICYPIFQSTPNPTPSPTPVPSTTLLPSLTPTDTPAPASSQTEAAKPVPKTGDTEDLILWGGIMLLGIGGLAFAMLRYHSKRKKR